MIRRSKAILAWCLLAGTAKSGEIQQPTTDWGDWSGRVRSISMHRDYSDVGAGNGSNTAVGLHLHYESPTWGWMKAGLTSDLVGELHREGDSQINLNDDIQILTEAWLRAQLTDSWKMTVGRQAVNGEILREDVFRHKSRAVEAVLLEFDGGNAFSFAAGHAIRLSNWLQFKDMAKFNSFGEVFRADEETSGMTWAEAVYSGLADWQFALFGCQAHDIAGLLGARARWQTSARSACSVFFRHEDGEGTSPTGADAFGFAWHQKLGTVDMEVGSFSVRGHKLLFEALTTGINHPLGSLMLICESPYDRGADSAYLRMTCQWESTHFYALYAYTAHDELPFDGHELNLAVNQQLNEQWSIALKFGYGLRQPKAGGVDHLTDSRVVVNYQF